MTRQMRLGLSLASIGDHDGAPVDGDMDFEHMARCARIGEAGKFDFVFFADSAAAPKPGRVKLEPLTLMAGLAAVTSQIGLVATASTLFQDPFHVARKLASIDHLSKGRAGWNMVTGTNPHEAQNFGPATALDSDTRHERAREFQTVVQRLFTSWEADAFPRDLASGIYMDRAKMNRLEHVGKHFKVRGPSDVARPPQGKLPIIAAGTSENAQGLAAEVADIVYGGQPTIEGARAHYAAIKARLPRYGRTAASLRMMPGIMPALGRTQQVADMMEEWFTTGAADGFMILPPPGGAEDFVALVIPELQRRGLFRTEYEGQTLRENLGLPISR
jgi:FMN-dependent oxidoreductase (nitrilotriacetate monooxygenase family)